MLVLAYSFEKSPKIDSQSAAVMLGATSAVCAAGAAFSFVALNERFRDSFWKHYPMSKHVREFWWETATVTTGPDGQVMEDCDRETIRAYTAMYFAKCYWPMDLVEPFVRDNWCVSNRTK